MENERMNRWIAEKVMGATQVAKRGLGGTDALIGDRWRVFEPTSTISDAMRAVEEWRNQLIDTVDGSPELHITAGTSPGWEVEVSGISPAANWWAKGIEYGDLPYAISRALCIATGMPKEADDAE